MTRPIDHRQADAVEAALAALRTIYGTRLRCYTTGAVFVDEAAITGIVGRASEMELDEVLERVEVAMADAEEQGE